MLIEGESVFVGWRYHTYIRLGITTDKLHICCYKGDVLMPTLTPFVAATCRQNRNTNPIPVFQLTNEMFYYGLHRIRAVVSIPVCCMVSAVDTSCWQGKDLVFDIRCPLLVECAAVFKPLSVACYTRDLLAVVVLYHLSAESS